MGRLEVGGEAGYLNLLQEILAEGSVQGDRTGVGTTAVFGASLGFDLRGGKLPLLTTKRVPWKGTFHELTWFLNGHTTIADLHPSVHPWWTPWADPVTGDLGPIYGAQYNRGGQFDRLLEQLKTDPHSRRHVLSLWDAATVDECRLPPCHGTVIQFFVRGKELHCVMYQRSADMVIGVPVNIASYAMLTHMIAAYTGYEAGTLKIVLGNAHIYMNHHDAVAEQVTREIQEPPRLILKSVKHPAAYRVEDLEVVGYNPAASIKVPLAI